MLDCSGQPVQRSGGKIVKAQYPFINWRSSSSLWGCDVLPSREKTDRARLRHGRPRRFVRSDRHRRHPGSFPSEVSETDCIFVMTAYDRMVSALLVDCWFRLSEDLDLFLKFLFTCVSFC